MKLRPELDKNKRALLKQHSEGDATASTRPTATASMTTQPTKHQLALEHSAEGQQTTWAENTGTSMKRPRLDLVDHVAASDLQDSSPSSVSSSRQHLSKLHPPSQVDELGNASIYTSLGENGSMIAPLQISYTLKLPPFYQPWAPSPVAGQTGGHFSSYATPIPNSDDAGDDEELDLDLLREFTHLDSPSEHGAAVFGSSPTFPSESLSSCQTSQQIASVANPDSQRDHLQPETPKSISCSSSQEQTTRSVPNTNVVTQVPPLADTVEKQTRHLSSPTGNTSFSLPLSKPAQAKDLDSFPWFERHLISAYARNQKDEEDVDLDFMRWYNEIRRPFWAQIISSFGKDVPGSLYDRVLDELCVSHPCRYDPWTGHSLYRFLLGKDGMRCLMTLKDWMYGTGTTTLPTWRDTLSTKIRSSSYAKVPWVQREKIIALSVILAGADAASTEIQKEASATRMKNNIQSKFEILEECQLTYLLSNQDHVVASKYWDGLAEELEEDPEQEHLYDKVMQVKQSTPSESSISPSSSPIHCQEAQEQGDQSHGGSPRPSRQGCHDGQAGPGGIGDYQILADVEESIPQYSGNHEPSSVAQQYSPPAENTNQDTEHALSTITQETSLQDRMRELEGEVTELRRYIESIYQQLPWVLQPPPQASSRR
ncbi:hypothetical protein INS49_002800 [Diaporthe citri]|uniref:uncharacterized protein n=1 Tax=Diaporthe citri TaxID=83186 RepID=UPI001C7FC657|nr:uncharacterized protein INS49_002800 [Diaporthe citri]KAG6368587.1 hypothetical protein INS49_002800 [Diaporthe citri]